MRNIVIVAMMAATLVLPALAADADLSSQQSRVERRLSLAEAGGELTTRQIGNFKKQLETIRTDLKRNRDEVPAVKAEQLRIIAAKLESVDRHITVERQNKRTAYSFFHWY